MKNWLGTARNQTQVYECRSSRLTTTPPQPFIVPSTHQFTSCIINRICEVDISLLKKTKKKQLFLSHIFYSDDEIDIIQLFQFFQSFSLNLRSSIPSLKTENNQTFNHSMLKLFAAHCKDRKTIFTFICLMRQTRARLNILFIYQNRKINPK